MQVPFWLTALIGVAIMVFGGYRVWLSRREGSPATYLGSKTADLVMGVVHVLAGLFLIALSFGLIPGLGKR
jgi:hypothetical protein